MCTIMGNIADYLVHESGHGCEGPCIVFYSEMQQFVSWMWAALSNMCLLFFVFLLFCWRWWDPQNCDYLTAIIMLCVESVKWKRTLCTESGIGGINGNWSTSELKSYVSSNMDKEVTHFLSGVQHLGDSGTLKDVPAKSTLLWHIEFHENVCTCNGIQLVDFLKLEGRLS